MEAVTAAGGAVFRRGDNKAVEVLLIHRMGVWDLPKGKQEDQESIEECAVREVAEETGTKVSPEIVAPLTETHHEYERGGKRYSKATFWFVMKFSDPSNISFHPQAEEGIEQVEWMPVSEAKRQVGYENLIKVLESLEKYIDAK